jgi:hypothetical protein
VSRAEAAARWLSEAWESGHTLRALPEDATPRDREEAEDAAGALCEALGAVPCGLRLVLREGAAPLAGPLLATRCLEAGRPVSQAGLPHAAASAAVLGLLAESLEPGATSAPVFASLRPALDVAASRYTGGAPDDLAAIADLAGLGLLVLGAPRALAPGVEPVALAAGRARPRGVPQDLAAAFALAATEARRLGGLPAGSSLAVAGLTPARAPEAGKPLVARLGALGTVRALPA